MKNMKTKSDWMRNEMPSTRKRNSLVLGFGINDADYVVDPAKKSGIGVCPAYHAWLRMIIRCHSKAFLKKNHTYFNASVCDDWRYFMKFREWWHSNVVDDWEIDKDLLIIGNRVYSADSCVFVPPWLNRFLLASNSARGDLPIGVYYHKREQRYRSQLSMGDGKQKTLGSFSSPSQAHSAWVEAKKGLAAIKKVDMDNIDVRIYRNVLKMISDMK